MKKEIYMLKNELKAKDKIINILSNKDNNKRIISLENEVNSLKNKNVIEELPKDPKTFNGMCNSLNPTCAIPLSNVLYCKQILARLLTLM